MACDEDVNRRQFLQRMGAGALLGVAGAANRQARASSAPAWTPPPVLKNPNILVVMVDQMRPPMWLPPAPFSMETVLPNIMGRIQNNSYNFEQFFVAATVCTPSSSCLLTGLYAPQTAMYVTGDPGTIVPWLNPAFPTWGEALATLNPAYKGNVWWFGKWHLSQDLVSSPLLPYGFNTRTYPGGPSPYNPFPDGTPNEGADGGPFQGTTWASDSMIAGDFIGWLQGQAPSSPRCATVSLVNPHDITWAPCTTYPDVTPPDAEFYGYNPQTTNNTSELGNDCYSTNTTTQNTVAQYTQVMGNLGSTLVVSAGTELNPPLVGAGTDGNPPSQAQAAAQQAYFAYVGGAGTCTGA